jgi:hypothetical protein
MNQKAYVNRESILKLCESLEKYDTKGNLIRTAEKFDSGSWVVSDFNTKKLLSGEYTNEEFKIIKKYF